MIRTLLPLIEAEYRRYKILGERAIAQLAPEEMLIRSGDGNSVATLVRHVSGNLESRYNANPVLEKSSMYEENVSKG